MAAKRLPRTCPRRRGAGLSRRSPPGSGLSSPDHRAEGKPLAKGPLHVKVKTLIFLRNVRGRGGHGRGAELLPPPAAPALEAERGRGERRAWLELERTGAGGEKEGERKHAKMSREDDGFSRSRTERLDSSKAIFLCRNPTGRKQTLPRPPPPGSALPRSPQAPPRPRHSGHAHQASDHCRRIY